jgi:hypothetical protein
VSEEFGEPIGVGELRDVHKAPSYFLGQRAEPHTILPASISAFACEPDPRRLDEVISAQPCTVARSSYELRRDRGRAVPPDHWALHSPIE